MRTRSGQRFQKNGTPPVPALEDEVHADEAASSSDDEAPEEQNFSTSRQTAAEQRKEEHKAREAAASQKRELRRSRTSRLSRDAPAAAVSGERSPSDGGELDSRDPDNALTQPPSDIEGEEDDYDFLPENVLREVDESSALNPRQAYEQSVVSQHLRAGAATQKRKPPSHSRRVAGIKVQVLSSVKPSAVSASARDFLKQRLYGADVHRSEAMLHPVNPAPARH